MTEVKPITTQAELDEAHRIRKDVFVKEQKCPEDIEWEYEEESHHYLALVGGKPAGTARWRETDKGIKLERFAVDRAYRTAGVGSALLKRILKDLEGRDEMIYLHAQISAEGFYLKHGLVPVGEHFWEADIEHVKMKCP